MNITATETLQAEMLEVDGDKRYLRLFIPSLGEESWHQPDMDDQDRIVFLGVPFQLEVELESLYQGRKS